MTDTPRLKILKEMGNRLRTISVANGYPYDIFKVLMERVDVKSDEEYPFIVYYPVDDTEEETTTSGREARRLNVIVACVDKYEEGSPFNAFEIVDKLAASVETCLYRFTTDPHAQTGRPDMSFNCLIATSPTNNGMIVDSFIPYVNKADYPMITAILGVSFSYHVQRGNKFLFK